jgi:hypothetical protein
MPVLGIGGETSHGADVGNALKGIANDVQSAVIPGAGHWFAEEAAEATMAALTPFLARTRTSYGRLILERPRSHAPCVPLVGAEWPSSEPLDPAWGTDSQRPTMHTVTPVDQITSRRLVSMMPTAPKTTV